MRVTDEESDRFEWLPRDHTDLNAEETETSNQVSIRVLHRDWPKPFLRNNKNICLISLALSKPLLSLAYDFGKLYHHSASVF